MLIPEGNNSEVTACAVVAKKIKIKINAQTYRVNDGLFVFRSINEFDVIFIIAYLSLIQLYNFLF